MGLAGIAAEFIAVFGFLDVATDPQKTLLDKVIYVVLVVGSIFGLVVLPVAWWVTRAIKRVPFVTIDERGIVWGRNRALEASIAWDEIARVERKEMRGGGVYDELVLVHPIHADAWYARQRARTRVLAKVSRALYGAPLAISTGFSTPPIDEILARIALQKPALIDR